jgi:hypothetical protein
MICFVWPVLACGSASADEVCRPVSAERIEEQWAYYQSQPPVQAIPGGDGYECIAVSKSSDEKVVCRTRAGHPAHPSIVVQVVSEENGAVYISLQADTAADCTAFLAMIDAFKKKNEALRQQFSKGR